MKLDIRLPIGLLFNARCSAGGLRTRHGVRPADVDRSLGIDINLWWGLVLLVFGGGMIYYSLRSTLSKSSQSKSV